MKNCQRGFSLVTGIFLLVVLAGLGAAMLTFSNVQHRTSALDVLGSRAYQAARAGIEWAAYQVVTNASAPAISCPDPGFSGALGGTLAPFTVTVRCSAASHVEGASTVWIYDVSSVAVAGTLGESDYVERQIHTKMGK